MLILGIETSCDETAASVAEASTDAQSIRVRSSIVSSQVDLHAEYGGVVPEIASRAHAERITPTILAALAQAQITFDNIDAIAVGHRPGLIGPLLVGVTAAKSLAWTLDVPLVGIDHVHAHLIAGMIERDPPALPALGLVVSGGHTAMYRLDALDAPVRLGATIDDAAGEAFDKAAAILGLAYPGGPEIDRLAEEGNPELHSFPISRLGRDSLDFSFSGVKTSLLYAVRGAPKAGGQFERDHHDLTESDKADFAAAFRRAVAEAIILKLTRAHDANPDARTLLTGGGVTANTLLRKELAEFARDRDLDLRLPDLEYCVDNAAMIAAAAAHRLARQDHDDLNLKATPTTAY